MKFLNSKAARRRSGTASVECALVVPFLAMVLMGTLSDAARKGCRTGIKRDKGNTDIVTEAKDVMNDNGFDASKFNPNSLGSVNITVTDPNGNVLGNSLDAPSGSVVSVQVNIPVSSTTWVAPFYLGSGSTLESETVVMMKQ